LVLIADCVPLGVERVTVAQACWAAVEKDLPIALMMKMIWNCVESNKMQMVGEDNKLIVFATGLDVAIL